MRFNKATLTNGVDYRADVKPISRAHFAKDLLWQSTLEAAAAVTAPDVGSAGSVNGSTTFVSGSRRAGDSRREGAYPEE
jgi:hypothetical protein